MAGPDTRCDHLLCEVIGGACSLATGRSRGCRPNLAAAIDPDLFDEVRALVAAIDPSRRDEPGVRAAANRLAELVRREARDNRNLVALARADEPDLAPALDELCRRRRPQI